MDACPDDGSRPETYVFVLTAGFTLFPLTLLRHALYRDVASS